MSPSSPIDAATWRGRRVLITGHTGFKGAWLALWLQQLGAEVTGFSDGVPTAVSLYESARVGEGLDDVRGDVRDPDAVRAAVQRAQPEVVLHLAAQPMVRRSYAEPRLTWDVNVLGTVNVLEAARAVGTAQAIVVVTSDKCYANDEQGRAFTEDDPMGGHDPYSSSKGAAELVTAAWRDSYFAGRLLASGRAGNVIGGGDWGEDRLVPDIMRAAAGGDVIAIRRPDAVRPWQHVLNPLSGYLLVAQRLLAGEDAAASGWNFGPAPEDVQPVRWIADRLSELWPEPLRWDLDPGLHPHEAGYLALDSTKAREQLGWTPRWDLEEALARIVAWHVAARDGEDLRALSLQQLADFTSG